MDATSSLVPIGVDLVAQVSKFIVEQIAVEKAEKTEVLVLEALKPFTKGWIFKKRITRTRQQAEEYVSDCKSSGDYNFPVYGHPFFHRCNEEHRANGFLNAVRYARGPVAYFSLEDAQWITSWHRDYLKFHDRI